MTEENGSRSALDPPKRPPPFKAATPPSLGLPKSGGSVRGLGEKFQAGAPTGTGSLRVPIAVSPCRDGAEPALALEYDSGQGRGPFGTGWRISVPSIIRRTDKGIPRYADAEESDVFILSGHEDLVPVLTADGGDWVHELAQDGLYRVDAYAPRVEGQFARIERRTNTVTGDAHWRTITPDNVTSVFGLSAGARVSDPQNPRHVFEWLLEATFDAFGNLTFYEYKQEDLSGVSAADLAEESRRALPPANCYLKRVHYGNRAPLPTRNPEYADLTSMSWCFEVVFDYGEHATDLPEEVAPWAIRADPFSTYRAGFEIRAYRLAQRVLMFHELPDELGAPARLVRATELGYDQTPAVTYLTTVRELGYAWDPDGTVTTADLPTLTLDYTRVGVLSGTVQTVDRSSLRQAPAGIDGQNYDFVDLDGEGIAGILTAAASPAPSLYYKRNLGGGKFGAAERLAAQPSLASMGADARLVSINNDGRLDVARFSGPTPGYYERTRSFTWAPFKPFQSLPKIDFAARGVHFLDVDGDGLTDILVAEDDGFVWYPSLSRTGYGPPSRVTQAHDEDRGAVVLTTDDNETIFLADMSGDGLSDLVRIRNASVCYWPNLGYGRFGAKITMRTPPVFDTPDAFDPRRVRLGDIDGTGPTDVVYLSRQGAVVYLNQAGNGWAEGIPVPLPLTETLDSVRIADLLGTGTSCLVWSSADPADAGTALRYVDLLHSTKPHLLSHVDNGLGAQTTITYAPSPQFYLEDRLAGRPWATRLPFVVQTVARVEVTDAVALTSSQVRYRYAHGFYDGVEREFRGFARVDSRDAESMSADHGAGTPPGSIDQDAGQYLLPPVRTTTWFHTGAWNGERDDLRAALSTEYYAGDPLAGPLPPTAVPPGLLPPDSREVYRALKGRPLRQEVYAEDGTDLAAVPYTVTEYRYEVRQQQPIAAQRHGVYFPFEREKAVYRYERDSAGPRISHDLTLEMDPLGHVTRSAQVAYARRAAAEPEQDRTLATCLAATFADPVATTYDYRHGTAAETVSYELFLAPGAAVLALADVDAAMTAATVLPFDGTLAAGTMRTIEHVRHQYWQDDLSAPAPIGTAGTRALSYNHFALALPATLAAAVFGARLAPGELAADAGYAAVDGDYWTQAGVITYDGPHFCQVSSYADPFGNTASVSYDAARLFVVEEHTSADAAFDNVTTVTMDYRALAPSLVTDPNGNRTAAAYDPLGMLAATAVMGRSGAGEGDTLADPTTRTDYHRLAWQDGQGPAYLHTYQRLQYGAANQGWFETYSYFDGTGHEVLKKTQAEPDSTQNPRWAGTGRIVYDNKGNPVKRYDPYFAPDPSYDSEAALAQTAYGAILRYDPASRVIRIDYPDGTFETTGWDAWTEVRSDPVDTVLDSAWYAAASARPAGDPLARAATLAARSANTPAVRVLDPLGRAFLTIADDGAAGQYPTRTALDIQGNALAVTDAIGNLTRQQVFDAQQNVLRRAGPDAGTSLAVRDVRGQAYRSWDPRGYAQLHAYDVLRRPARVWVTPPGGEEFLAEQLVYGEGLPGPNFRGHLYQHFDGAGVLTNAAYDLEARITRTTRQLAADYTDTPHWDPLAALTDPASFLPAALGLLEGDVFDTTTTWDAMSRLVSVTTPDQATVVPQYDTASRLGSVAVTLPGAAAPAPVVTSVAYNARGQRTSVTYADSISTEYTYDDGTRLVTDIRTTRQSDAAVLQDLSYTYDPVHNVVQVTDQAQQTVYFAGSVTSGTQLFEYDAVYRLISAAGREQPGQVGYAAGPRGYPDPPINPLPHPNDLQALVAYTETYSYDAVSNLLATVHLAGGTSGTGWTRTQTYVAGSNRLDRASLPGDPAGGPYSAVYSHDLAGNLDLMPNLTGLTWDYTGRLASAELAGGGSAYFAYDGSGQRVRKVIQRSGRIWERVYASGYERYRERTGASVGTSVLTLERHTVHASDGARRFALIETKTVDTSVTGLVPAPLFRFQFPNHLGSACLETDQTGAVISYEEYYPYGGSSYRAGETDKRYRFTGQERDEETGLYYAGARYYVPWLARWASCDPAGAADGFNLYQYARSNPVRYTDPAGFQSDDDHDDDSGGGGDTQMSLPALGITNASPQGQYPVGTLRTEFLTTGGFQSRADRSGSFIPTFQQYLSVGDRLSDTLELNVFGSAGNTQSSLGLGLHLGPPAPSGEGLVKKPGLWLTLSQVWGQEPPPPPLEGVPPGWSFNPTLNAFGAYSIQKPNKWGLDFNLGGTASRWGSIIGVPVSGLVSPFVGANLWGNLGANDVLNVEATNALNFGLGGRQDLASPGGGVPRSDSLTVGVGWQHTFDKSDYALGLELTLGYEGLANITNDAGERHGLTGGLRFGWGAINPRRNQYPELPGSMR
jgi:RHS repeat-associated protein